VTRRTFLASATASIPWAQSQSPVLDPESFRHYVDEFNANDPEDVNGHVPNASAWDWMKANIPWFACPDPQIERTYYFRWWTIRKHIKQTPDGFLITEFLKKVGHAGEYNSLSCAFGHHVAEARWLRDPQWLDGDVAFWLHGRPRQNFHQFSGWAAAALWDRYRVDGRRDFVVSYLESLITDYEAWERERLTESGLFWQRDVSDGMEESVSGGRRVRNVRPTINSYQYGNAKAIAEIARLAARPTIARTYRSKAARLKELVERRLWNREDRFFETLDESGKLAGVREQIGYTPWMFGLPSDREEYAAAWAQLADPKGFSAPYGPTTAEQRHPGFRVAYEGDDCQWNGPSWPFATTVTLKALANVLHDYRQRAVSKDDYFRAFEIYTRSHRLKLPDGREIPWIDENLNPYTGEWLARARKIEKGTFYGRGDYYNHSGYCDLVISGLVGLRPGADGALDVRPLVPEGKWDWFCLDQVPYHGRSVTVVWDRSGARYGRGKGLRVIG
jgi:hypothetical protein